MVTPPVNLSLTPRRVPTCGTSIPDIGHLLRARVCGTSIPTRALEYRFRLGLPESGRSHVRQFWETSRDGGSTWEVAFDGHYQREN